MLEERTPESVRKDRETAARWSKLMDVTPIGPSWEFPNFVCKSALLVLLVLLLLVVVETGTRQTSDLTANFILLPAVTSFLQSSTFFV